MIKNLTILFTELIEINQKITEENLDSSEEALCLKLII